MEKEITKNRQATEMTLITAVNDIIEESGFEGLGINAVAAKAKVSKMLIYRYFNSLDGLIAAYIQQNDYWINFDEELPDQAHLAAFIKQIFKRQIMWLRENYTLKRLYRWELTTDNKFVKELRNKREEKGIWLVEAVSKLSKHPKKEIAGRDGSQRRGYVSVIWHCSKKTARSTTASRFSRKAAGRNWKKASIY